MSRVLRLLRRPVDLLDYPLDRLTSYRLVLYVLLAELGLGIIFAAIGQVPFKWWQLLASGVFLVAISVTANYLLSRVLKIPKNSESDYISGLILALILSPAATGHGYLILAVAALTAQVSKYAIVLRRRHIFNPAALGAVVVGAAFHSYASWWVGTAALLPLVALGGILIARKLNRYLMILAFIAAYLAILALTTATGPADGQTGQVLWLAVSASPLVFFASVMLTEPQTSPARKRAYIPYALLTAALFGVSRLHVTPEQALLAGNGLAFLLEPARRLKLTLVSKVKEAEGIYSFLFNSPKDVNYLPGQYMEWTLPGSTSDTRGNRRYLTVSSAPEENQVMFTIKMPTIKPSHFKSKLNKLKPGAHIWAFRPAGSFTLPADSRKMVMVAGGVGITPFRSMVQHLILSGRSRPMTLIYAASQPAEFAFRQLWVKAKRHGLKTTYLVTGDQPPAHWGGRKGRLDAALIKEVVPAYKDSAFYISGPYGFVGSARDELLKAGVAPQNIVTDYFPGYGQ